jgi:5-methylcytosine-specific restriction endonuclease McrBC regulatory subunit McrC
MNPIVDNQEHSTICSFNSEQNKTICNFNSEEIKKFNEYFTSDEIDKKIKYLGLHQEVDNYEVKLKSYYYIGYRWFDEEKEEYISISPKIYEGKKADYLAMYLECLKDPIVSQKLDESIKIFYNEKWIETKQTEIDINPFIIFQFLKVVKKISQKGLKKGYIKVTENLTSKIKGKILVNQTIKQNHFRNRLDKTVCNHQIFTINCVENQIIKTALLQSGRHLQRVASSEISKMLKQNLNAFELVDKREVFDSDFRTIKHSPFYKDYKEALHLAQMIFKRFGFSLNASNEEKQTKFPPFYINMPELFERYVEVKLRKQYNDILDGNRLEKKLAFEMRPDFLLPSKNMIIDAKYKYWFEQNIGSNFKDDFQQLSLYGRENTIRDDYMNLKDSNEEAILLFIYPKINTSNEIDENKFKSVEKFNNIKIFSINIS